VQRTWLPASSFTLFRIGGYLSQTSGNGGMQQLCWTTDR
jgi:hypothetical protein